MTRKCKICNLEFEISRYNGSRQYCTFCLPTEGMNTSERKSLLRKVFKKKLLEIKGDKCSRCGYDKCTEALEFHHLDPSKKEFTISRYYSTDWNDYLKEVEKCILVCSNCHKEIHSGEKI
jgi:hypothetical protein